MSAGDGADDWFALSRAVLVEALAEPSPPDDPAPAPAPRGRGWPRFRRTASTRRPHASPGEAPAARANRVALAATAGDWETLGDADRDLLRRALASDAGFARLADALDAAPAPRAMPADEAPPEEPGFVFDPVFAPVPARAPATGRGPDDGRGADPPPLDPWFGLRPVPAPPARRDAPPPAGPAEAPSPVPDPALAVRAPPPAVGGASGSAPSHARHAPAAPVPGHGRNPNPPMRVAGLDVPLVDALDAPLLATLRGECGGAVTLRAHGGGLTRSATLPGGLAPVTAAGLGPAMAGDTGLARAADAGALLAIDGEVYVRTAAPTLHVACVRSVRPLGRAGGWLQPRPSDGHRLAWRFPDGPDSLGWGGGPRGDRAVTWDLADDPGPVHGMVAPPSAHGEPALSLGLAHAALALGTYMAAMEALAASRPDLPWHDPDVPDVLRGDDMLMSPGPDEARARLRDGARPTAVADALWSAERGNGTGFEP